MSFKVLVAAISRAGSFFNLTSVDYGTVVDAVKDVETQLEKAAGAEGAVTALTARVEALEKQRDTPSAAMPLGGQQGLMGDFQQAAQLAQNLRQGG